MAKRDQPRLGRGIGDIVADHRSYGAAEQLFERTDGLTPPDTNIVTEWAYPASSRVRAYRYDFANQTLQVRFHKYDDAYEYYGVPTAVYASFDSSPSKGRFINSTLNSFTYAPVAGTLWTD